MHRAAGSICEGCGLSDTYIRGSLHRLCISKVPDDVHIPPILEMKLHRCHALPLSICEKLWWYNNNSTWSNTNSIGMIMHNNQH